MGNGQFKVGDYIYYEGHRSVSGPLKDPGVGIITQFHTPFDKERIQIYLRDRDQEIWTDYDKVTIIKTDDTILKKCGFTAEEVNGKSRYRRDDMVISGTFIGFQGGQLYLAGFCVGDFTSPQNVDIQKYNDNGKVNVNLFHHDFPHVYEINDLFTELKARDIKLDKNDILAHIK